LFTERRVGQASADLGFRCFSTPTCELKT
jgi:hypothetical protein